MLSDGSVGMASVPSGASPGIFVALLGAVQFPHDGVDFALLIDRYANQRRADFLADVVHGVQYQRDSRGFHGVCPRRRKFLSHAAVQVHRRRLGAESAEFR